MPDAIHGNGRVFGWALAGIVMVHAVAFRVAGGESSARAIVRLLPVNLAAAILVVIGGYAHGTMVYAWWGGAVALLLLIPSRTRNDRGFVVRPEHFCDRHSAVLIIAIGESIVGVGAGLAGIEMDLTFFVEVGLGLSLCYVLWWAFFGADDERGMAAMKRLSLAERSRPALMAYGYATIPMLLGLLFAAAGLGMTISHSGEEATWAQVAVTTIPLGAIGQVWMQLVAILVFVYAVIIVDDFWMRKSGEHSHYL